MRELLITVLFATMICGVSYGQRPRNQPKSESLSESEKNKLEGWRLASLGANNMMMVLYNRDRISQVSPSIKRVWFKTYLAWKPKERYRYTIGQHEFNCETSESRIVHLVQYRENGTVYKESAELTGWSPIIPATVSDELFQIICKGEESYEDMLEKDAEQSYAKGQYNEKQGDYPKALQFYQKAVSHDPGNLTYKLAVKRLEAKRAKP